jgi:hypothetical protein
LVKLKIDARGKRVLLIPDLHCPYHHRKLLPFLRYLKQKYKPDIVIFLGDEVDGHSWSFHNHDPELPSPGEELRKAIKVLQKVYKIFPDAYILNSNHGSLLNRKTKANGLPQEILRPLRDLYKTPGWSWWDRIVLNTDSGPVLIGHGMSGQELGWAKSEGMSTVEGHYHTIFRVSWKSFLSGKELFSMHLGCLINYTALAFEYARTNMHPPMMGAGILRPDGEPELIRLSKVKL